MPFLTQDKITYMIRRDMQEVFDIEAASFEYAWTEKDFLACLKQRNCIGLVAKDAGIVKGFVLYELLKHQIHILNFAVHPLFLREGVGTAMVEKMVFKVSQQRRTELVIEVRDNNLPAQLFLKSQEFVATRVLREFYEPPFGDFDDAYQMRWQLRDLSRPYAPVNRVTAFLTTEDV